MDSTSFNPDQVSQLAQAVFQYGPSALLVVVGLLFTRIAGRQLRDNAADKESRRVFRGIVVAVWACAFVLIGFSVMQWWFPRHAESTLRGTLKTLQGSEDVVGTSVDPHRRLFVCKTYRKDGLFEIDWRVVSDTRLADGTRVQFLLDNGEFHTPTYELVVHSEQYSSGVEIHYLRERDSLVAHFAGKVEPLVRVSDEASIEPLRTRLRWPSLVEAAAAAMPLRPNDLTLQLDSDDPVLRRSAWTALARRGPAGVAQASTYLADPQSSLRLRLGAIAALNAMKGVPYDSLSPAALAAIVEVSVQSDSSASWEARRFMIRAHDSRFAAPLEQRLSSARAGNNTARAAALARSGLELYHNIGFVEEAAYAAPNADRDMHFARSVAAYMRAWELCALAAPAERRYFPKALWGWANMLHDRWWLERSPTGGREPARGRAARERFSEFLRQCDATGASAAGLYRAQREAARRYLVNQVPTSLAIRGS